MTLRLKGFNDLIIQFFTRILFLYVKVSKTSVNASKTGNLWVIKVSCTIIKPTTWLVQVSANILIDPKRNKNLSSKPILINLTFCSKKKSERQRNNFYAKFAKNSFRNMFLKFIHNERVSLIQSKNDALFLFVQLIITKVYQGFLIYLLCESF